MCKTRIAWTLIALSLCGCTSMSQYVKNGFKVGPSYGPPTANVAQHWIDAADVRLRSQSPELSHWWTAFNDPVLNGLICDAYQQNLTLKVAGMRVLEARAQLAIAKGEFFPQTQTGNGSYMREGISVATADSFPGIPRFFDQWSSGFTLAWELDFWGRLRRAIESSDDQLCASVENYDDVLVTLLSDVANAYVLARQAQQEIAVARGNADLQRWVLELVREKYKAGAVSELDVDQAETNLANVEAAIPQFEITLRQQENQLCILLGMPPCDLAARMGLAPIPAAAPDTVVGIPAQLLCRRPDVRRAQFNAAAQAEQIGIAMAQFYPTISVNGTIDWQAARFGDLFKTAAFGGSVGPSFSWNILNYGRIQNNVRFQDATFQELLLTYRNTVLAANQDVENGIVTFLRSQQREKLLAQSVVAAEKAKDRVIEQYQQGARVGNVSVDFNRVAVILQALVQQQDLLAQSRGQIATGLISVYRALGGGWEIRLAPQAGQNLLTPPAAAKPAKMIPVPTPPEDVETPAPAKNAGRKDLPMTETPPAAPLAVPDVKPDRKPLP